MTSPGRTVPPAPSAPQLTVADLTLAFRAAMQAERDEADAAEAPLPDEVLSAPTAANFQLIKLVPLPRFRIIQDTFSN